MPWCALALRVAITTAHTVTARMHAAASMAHMTTLPDAPDSLLELLLSPSTVSSVSLLLPVWLLSVLFLFCKSRRSKYDSIGPSYGVS